jgi:hypothetical protein
MARATTVIQANTFADLTSAVNTFLAAFTAGASRKIVGFYVGLVEQDRSFGTMFTAIITTESTGAAAQASPYVFTAFDAGSATDMVTLLTAYFVANTNFTTGVRNLTQANVSRLQRVTAWAVASADAANGASNWTPV